jgi:hypothetical protein
METWQLNIIIALICGVVALIVHSKLKDKKRMAEIPSVETWFEVTFDADRVYMNVSPPGKDAWHQEFRWDDIIRICFKSEDLGMSDGLYFFTRARPESYVIPLEGKGGSELWVEVINRGLFDADLAIEAAGCVEEKLFCWPPDAGEGNE